MSVSAGARSKLASEGKCRLCPATTNLTLHHLVPRKWFRKHAALLSRNNPHNLIPLCNHCHELLDQDINHEDPDRFWLKLAKRNRLRQLLTAEEKALAVELAGSAWFESNYPLTHRNHSYRLLRSPGVSCSEATESDRPEG